MIELIKTFPIASTIYAIGVIVTFTVFFISTKNGELDTNEKCVCVILSFFSWVALFGVLGRWLVESCIEKINFNLNK